MDDSNHEQPTDTGSSDNPYTPPAPTGPTTHSFSLLTALLLMTLLCVWLAVTIAAPGIGMGMLGLGVPALLRTFWVRKRRKLANRPTDLSEKVAIFLASLGIVALISASSAAAFCAVCYPIGWLGFGIAWNGENEVGGAIMIGGWILGFIVGGIVLFFVVKWTWKLGA